MNAVELMLRVDGRAILLGRTPTEPNWNAESYCEPIADLLFKCAAPALVQDAATRTWKRINRRRPKRGADVPQDERRWSVGLASPGDRPGAAGAAPPTLEEVSTLVSCGAP